MDGSPCTTNSRLLAARLSSALDACSAPIAQAADTTAPATRPRAAAYSHRFHRTRRIQDRANTMHVAAAKGMAISNVTGAARSPSSASAAMLSTNPQLAHKPAQRLSPTASMGAVASHARARSHSYADAIFNFGEFLLTDPRYAHKVIDRGKGPVLRPFVDN